MTRLKELLQGYETWALPHMRDPAMLTKAQRAENLSHVLAIKDARIARLRDALPEVGEHLAALLDPAVHPFQAVRALDDWWVQTGLQLKLFPPVTGGIRSKLFRGRFYAANEALAYSRWNEWPDHPLVAPLDSLLLDMALIVGDAIVLRRPDFTWTVNEDMQEKREQTVEWGRVVVMRAGDAGHPAKAFDLFALARWSYADLHMRRQRGFSLEAVDVGRGEWRGTFVGWLAAQVIDGVFTPDHYPQGREGPALAGRWANSPASAG